MQSRSLRTRARFWIARIQKLTRDPQVHQVPARFGIACGLLLETCNPEACRTRARIWIAGIQKLTTSDPQACAGLLGFEGGECIGGDGTLWNAAYGNFGQLRDFPGTRRTCADHI